MAVEVTEDSLTAELSDGRVISAPLAWYPSLVHATPEEPSNWELIGSGEGIHWQIWMRTLVLIFCLQGKNLERVRGH